MVDVYCPNPNCARKVDRTDESCPVCGTQLSFTIVESDHDATPTAPPIGKLHFEPGEKFADRYTIIEKIGAGGMGVVYKAIDTELDTGVALKLIQPALLNMPSFVERFRREVKLTRQINHPNIIRVHDIGRSGDILYLSMEWIEGETLQQLLKKAGVLRETKALELTEKIAHALEAAHDAGIIHRDLKPANIMVSERGNVRVLDFGLALRGESGDLTGAGLLLGTPNYMAPEQRRREKLDGRADIYALGLILYEMLTGQRKIMDTAGVGEITSISPLIQPVVDRMTAEDRDQRFGSAAEVREAMADLRDRTGIEQDSTIQPVPGRPARRGTPWWALGAGAIAVAAAAIGLFWWFTRPSLPPPCANADAELYHGRGMEYLREWSETVESAKNARNLFEQSLNEDPDCAKAMAGMIEADWLLYRRDSSPIWRDEAEDVTERALQVAPDLPELRTAIAVGYIFIGKYDEAVKELEQAVKDRPKLAMAWAKLGEAYSYLGEKQKGLQAVREAVDLRPDSHRMHVYLGIFHLNIGEYAEATNHFTRAKEMKPDSWLAWNNLGSSYLYRGQFREAVGALDRALEIEDSANARSNLGTAYYFLDRFGDALEQYRRATELDPRSATHWGNLADAHLAMGDETAAREAYGKAVEAADARANRETLTPEARMELAMFCAKVGDEARAVSNARMALAIQGDNPLLLQRAAAIHCSLEQDEQCLDRLEEAVKHGGSKAQIDAEPEFARLREDPRFREILERAQ